MIFRAHVTGLDWLTLVVRAHSEANALELARDAAAEYTASPPEVALERLDVLGPERVLIEDAS